MVLPLGWRSALYDIRYWPAHHFRRLRSSQCLRVIFFDCILILLFYVSDLHRPQAIACRECSGSHSQRLAIERLVQPGAISDSCLCWLFGHCRMHYGIITPLDVCRLPKLLYHYQLESAEVRLASIPYCNTRTISRSGAYPRFHAFSNSEPSSSGDIRHRRARCVIAAPLHRSVIMILIQTRLMPHCFQSQQVPACLPSVRRS